MATEREAYRNWAITIKTIKEERANRLKQRLSFISNYLIFILVVALSGICSAPVFGGEVLVKLKPGASLRRANYYVPGHGRKLFVERRFSHLFPSSKGEVILLKDKDITSEELLRKVKSDPDVLKASLNYRRRILEVPNDPLYSQEWFSTLINAPQAWELTTGSRQVVVMVADSGLEPTQEDLADNMWTNPNDPPNGYDDDKNGYVDDTNGIDAISRTGMVFDGEGHGTHVAGIIGATGNNGKGLAGVNWKISIVSCRFIDSTGYGSDSDAIACFDYAAELKKKGVNLVAINASWGGYEDNPLLKEALERVAALGIAVVAAAGNERNNNDAVPLYPASYQIPGLISVASFGKEKQPSYFTNTGPGLVTLAAPGEQVVSTYTGLNYQPSSEDIFYDPCNSNWSKWDRTGTWQVTSEDSHDGSMAWSDSPYGDYNDNDNSYITSPEINLSGASGTCAVGFWAKANLENGYDYLLVQASRDNFKWTTIGSLTGTTFGWKSYSFYLPDQLKSRTLRIRLKMDTDESIHYDGVYVDDIGINCGEYTGTTYRSLSGTSMATPFVTGALALLAAKYPEEPTTSLVARLLGGVKKESSFTEITSTGGSLDLYGALTSPPQSLITRVSPEGAAEGDAISVDGTAFGDNQGTVWFETSDGKRKIKGEVVSWSDSHIVVNLPNKNASYLRVEREDGALSPRFLGHFKNQPLPLPAGPRVYSLYMLGLPPQPKVGGDPATTVPFSLGEDSYTTMHLFVKIPQFEEPVDVCVAIQGVSYGTGDPLFLITSDSSGVWHTYNSTSPVLEKYAENTLGPIEVKDLLAPGFPADEIPLDWELNFFLAVVPAGSQDWSRYYLWWVDWY